VSAETAVRGDIKEIHNVNDRQKVAFKEINRAEKPCADFSRRFPFFTLTGDCLLCGLVATNY
jgi:hypothetical protein